MTQPAAAPDERGAPIPVEVLTDEELAVLATPGAMPVTPFLRDLDPTEAQVAQRTAYRSLVARGIVDPPTAAAIAHAASSGEKRVELMVRQDVGSVMALRAGARVVVAVARTTAATQDFWYAHLVEDVVLLEEVSGDGLHRFALADAERLTDLAEAAAVHPDAGDGTNGPSGPPVPVHAEEGDPTPPTAVLQQLGEAFVRADVVVRRPDDTEPPAFALFTGPAGCWHVAPQAPGVPPVAQPVTAEAARRRVTDAIAQVRAEAVLLGGR